MILYDKEDATVGALVASESLGGVALNLMYTASVGVALMMDPSGTS